MLDPAVPDHSEHSAGEEGMPTSLGAHRNELHATRISGLREAASQVALLAAVLAAGLLVLAVVVVWLVALGLAADTMLAQLTLSLVGDSDLRDRWSVEQCFLAGVGASWPLVAACRRWLLDWGGDPDAAGPVRLLGVNLAPGPVSIALGVLCGVVVLATCAAVAGTESQAWRPALAGGAAACSVALVWRAGATLAAERARAVGLWLLSGSLGGLIVGVPVQLLL